MAEKQFLNSPKLSGRKILLIVSVILVSIYLVFLSQKDSGERKNFCRDKAVERTLMKEGTKTVLLIHGYPEPIYKNHPLYKYFDDRGYSIIAPYLFTPEFKLTQEEVRKYVKKEIGEGKEPDVIVGVSLGGLLAPSVASDFSKAKLVLIATGPYVRTRIAPLNEFLKLGKAIIPIYEVVKHAPTWLYSIVYRIANHPKMNAREKEELEVHIREGWACVGEIPAGEDQELIDFLISTDNTILLKSLNNKTLIIAGEGDIMMPPQLSLEMRSLIKNSELVLNKNRLHFGVFGESDYKQLDDFLGR